MKIKQQKFHFNTVMLIDDSELDNFINEQTIKANAFAGKIYVHTSGKSALEFFSNLISLGEKYIDIHPQVIFLDINMPMMDGFQFIEQFKRTVENFMKNTQIVILTSSVYHEDSQRARNISDKIIFLNKPLTMEMLDKIR